ncbi:hypothetical protein [Pseudomonas frederiksbergensis]|uniref:hypothetical protein n=1 Tax=Pseudomonas frederiksbergensis TaxID=104087 RepID=UPI003D1FF6B5
MADFIRLNQDQKNTFRDVFNAYETKYDIEESRALDEVVQDAVDKFDGLPPSDQYILISKPEVHSAIWTALKRAHTLKIGKVEDFENGDVAPEYRKSMKVDKNLLEAVLALLAALVQAITNALPGKGSVHGGDDRSHKAGKKPRTDAQDAYER